MICILGCSVFFRFLWVVVIIIVVLIFWVVCWRLDVIIWVVIWLRIVLNLLVVYILVFDLISLVILRWYFWLFDILEGLWINRYVLFRLVIDNNLSVLLVVLFNWLMMLILLLKVKLLMEVIDSFLFFICCCNLCSIMDLLELDWLVMYIILFCFIFSFRLL